VFFLPAILTRLIFIMIKRIFLSLALVCALGFSCTQQEQQQQVQVDEKGGRCVKGNCQYGVGTYVFANGNRYEGEFRSNVPFGYGTMYYKNGKSIKGKWKWGRPDLR
jgi:hypothetical protein